MSNNNLKDIFGNPGDLAIFFGAGISYNSGMPLAKDIVRCVLEILMAGNDNKANEIDIVNILQKQIPLEQLLEIVSEKHTRVFEDEKFRYEYKGDKIFHPHDEYVTKLYSTKTGLHIEYLFPDELDEDDYEWYLNKINEYEDQKEEIEDQKEITKEKGKDTEEHGISTSELNILNKVNFENIRNKIIENHEQKKENDRYCDDVIKNPNLESTPIELTWINNSKGILAFEGKTILGGYNVEYNELIEVISQKFHFNNKVSSDLDDIEYILEIFKLGKPNINHKIIAKLAYDGLIRIIFTTNFDILLEMALEEEGLKRDQDYICIFRQDELIKIKDEMYSNKILLVKMHGSIAEKDSILTTINRLKRDKLKYELTMPVEYLFKNGPHQKVLILGYSCSDKFDINPLIESYISGTKEVYYIHHDKSKNIENIIEEDLDLKKDNNTFSHYKGLKFIVDTDSFMNSVNETILDYAVDSHIDSQVVFDWKVFFSNWFESLANCKDIKLYLIGRIFFELKDYKNAAVYLENSLSIAKDVLNTEAILKYSIELAKTYFCLGNGVRAIEVLENCLTMAIIFNKLSYKSEIIFLLGMLEINYRNGHKGIQLLKESETICYIMKDKYRLKVIYENLIFIFETLGFSYSKDTFEYKMKLVDLNYVDENSV